MNSTSTSSLSIGVFDSGLGGLTVVRAIREQLPNERICYLGDNARVPYGTRSPKTIQRYAKNCAEFLLKQGPKMLVVACNTVSAVALPTLRAMTDIPVIGVIEAGAQAVATSGARRIGVIGTQGTIGSNAYVEKIRAAAPHCLVYQKATPLFVPLAEEGWIGGEVPEAVARHYLESLTRKEIDLLLLGCTHYPILADTLRRALTTLCSKATVVDSASSMAASVSHILTEKKMLAPAAAEPASFECFVTDLPATFEEVASRFLGVPPGVTKQIDIS